MLNDLRYALRRLLKAPGFTALTLTVLTAGLALCCYMYVLLQQLAYTRLDLPNSDRLYIIDAISNGFERNGGTVWTHDFRIFEKGQTQFEMLVPTRQNGATLTGGEFPERVVRQSVRPSLFSMVQASAARGRVLQAEDSNGGAKPVVVLGDRLWKTYFAGDENIVGRSIQVDGKPLTVVGVMPEGFQFPDMADIWVPLDESTVEKPTDSIVAIRALLRKDGDAEKAQTEFSDMAKALAQQFPQTHAERSVKVWPYTQANMANSMFIIYMLAGASVAILMLVWVNVGNLLLARALESYKETAIRSALGAPRAALLRQMITEGMLLSLSGALFGIFFAGWALDATRPLLEATSSNGRMPFWWTLQLSGESILFCVVLAICTGLLTTFLPAWRAANGNVASVLRDGTRGARGRHAGRWSRALVITEIGLSAALLITAGVMIVSVNRAVNMEYGAQTRDLASADVSLSTPVYSEQSARDLFAEKLQQQISQAPGNPSVTLSSVHPGAWADQNNVVPEGSEFPDKRYPAVNTVQIGTNYLEMFAIPLRNGRAFVAADTRDSLPVVLVSERFAKRWWPDSSALGKRVQLDPDSEKAKWATVVGVVGDVIYGQPLGDTPAMAAVYQPLTQSDWRSLAVVIRSSQTVTDRLQSLRRALAAVDNSLPLVRPASVDEHIAQTTSGIRFVSKLFISIAVLGLLLAASGIYGVTSHAVLQRTQELGVRRAVGASDRNILGMLARTGGLQLLIGISIGGAVGVAGGLFTAALFYDVGAVVPMISVAVVLLICAIVMTANWLPARRAIAVTPMDALRYE